MDHAELFQTVANLLSTNLTGDTLVYENEPFPSGYFITNKGAPRLKVVKVDLSKGVAGAQFTDLVPEREETLERAQIVGNRLILGYLKDAASKASEAGDERSTKSAQDFLKLIESRRGYYSIIAQRKADAIDFYQGYPPLQ